MTPVGRLATAAVLLFLTVPASSQDAAPPPATAAATSPAARFHAVARGSLSPEIKGDAVLDPVDPLEVRVRAKQYAGELLVLYAADDGAAVKKGDAILQIDPDPLNREIAAAENELTLASAGTKKAQEDVRLGEAADALALESAQKEVENATAAQKWWETAEGPDMLKQADLMLKMARDSIDDQEDELDQLRKMYKTEDLTTATADIVVKRAVRQLTRSQDMLKITENQTAKARNLTHPQTKFTVEQATKKAQIALEQLKVAHAQARVARRAALLAAELNEAKASLKARELRSDLAQLKVAAPYDGVVYRGQMQNGAWQNPNPRALDKGEKVQPQQVLLTLVAPGKLRAVSIVPEDKLAFVKVGQTATVSPKLLPEVRYNGKVSKIARTAITRANVTGFEVDIDAGPFDGRLAPGMTAAVEIEAGNIDGVLLVPVSAVEAGKVKLAPEGKPEEDREVVTGRTDGKMIEIVKGLAEGDRISLKQ